MKQVSDRTKDLDGQRAELEEKIGSFLADLPNLLADDVPAGGKENNQVLRAWGNTHTIRSDPVLSLAIQF